MRHKFRLPFSNLTFENWQNLLIFIIVIFYSFSISNAFGRGPIESGFAGDYLAFWSAGKIADEKAYSEVYDLENLKHIQVNELGKLGVTTKINVSAYSPFPVAMLPVFIAPFQLLSKINILSSYGIWISINFLALIGYLLYYIKKISPDGHVGSPGKKLILLMLISYPMWRDFAEGQVNILLVLCMGEYIRNAITQKPFLSGLWLGGLLLKPQVLVLVIPALLILCNWRVIKGFLLSSMVIILSSFLLVGSKGIKSMLAMWAGFSVGMATNAPQRMINWRMIGVRLNSLFGNSSGWIVAALGMVLTIMLVFLLVKAKPSFGSPVWIITMATVLCSTLAVTWHSHIHMAVILIPFLIYASLTHTLSNKIIFAWASVTSLLFIFVQIIAVLSLAILKKPITDMGFLVAYSGFGLNALIFISLFHFLSSKKNNPEIPITDYPKR